MRTGTEQEMILKAIDAFRNKLVVVSPDYRILAWRRNRDAPSEGDGAGQLCYQVLHARSEPCGHCAVKTVL
ncbi:MAG TPA: PAS domain-containing sensor histidine kinase, partial [Desulfobacterales bacterium]|nr:PAS domain-containing sensor histidine kinase [Desulfobacterales bacterium]